ncbi:MAG TPA: DUF1127 domain-containing protein [Alphaproteobacteria bacterium]|nr:DUF1127 domain-containing protein [Alphaproteobacteria bacterium]
MATITRGAGAPVIAAAPVRGLWCRLVDALDRRRGRRHLATLTDDMLRDIGLSRADVESELSKPFWR